MYNVNLIGKRFGYLTVVSLYENKSKEPKWVCLCDCGGTLIANAYGLVAGRTTCCGPNHFDMIGRVFGKLTVIKRMENSKGNNNRRWLCKCTCGEKKIATTTYLKNGKTSHCGCSKKAKYVDRTIPAINILIGSYKRISKIKNREFILSREQFIDITSSNCHYCGEPPNKTIEDNLRGNKSYYTYNGIDRKDSSKGYTPENSLPCCTKCNFVKGSTSYDLFKQWITNITKNIDNIAKLL